MASNKRRLRSLSAGAMIAALYAAVSLAPFISIISFGAVQFRVAEALTVLAALLFPAVPGLTIGCVIANAAGAALGYNGLGYWDVLFGGGATLIAALLSYALRNIKVRGLPVLSLLPPIIINALVIGAELTLFLPEKIPYWVNAGSVALGETAVILFLGVPLYFTLRRTKLFHDLSA